MNTSHSPTDSTNRGDRNHAAAGTSAVDPVCGMQVDPIQTAHHAEHEGLMHHFCSAHCRERFVAEPARFLSGQADDDAAQAPAGTTYICPMHPEVRQEDPGICPICGMALEPEMPGLDDEDNPELRDFSRRFWWTLPATTVVVALAMFGHYFPTLPR